MKSACPLAERATPLIEADLERVRWLLDEVSGWDESLAPRSARQAIGEQRETLVTALTPNPPPSPVPVRPTPPELTHPPPPPPPMRPLGSVLVIARVFQAELSAGATVALGASAVTWCWAAGCWSRCRPPCWVWGGVVMLSTRREELQARMAATQQGMASWEG